MSFAWHALPPFSSRWDGLPKRTYLRYCNSTQKNDWTVFITFLFPFILFSLWFASTFFTIINHPFRLPRAGAHWFTSCCSLGWSEKHKSWKMQKVGVDSKPRHSTDFRICFSKLWLEYSSCAILSKCVLHIYPLLQGENGQNEPENQQNWNMAKIAPKSNKFMKFKS